MALIPHTTTSLNACIDFIIGRYAMEVVKKVTSNPNQYFHITIVLEPKHFSIPNFIKMQCYSESIGIDVAYIHTNFIYPCIANCVEYKKKTLTL